MAPQPPVQGPSIAESEGKPRVAPAPTQPSKPNTTPPAASTLTPKQQELAGLLLPGTNPQPQQPAPVGGIEDLDALVRNPPKDGQTLNLPSGMTIKDEQVDLPNGLIGNKTTATVPGLAEPVVTSPGLMYTHQQQAGLFKTDDSYTPQQRDRDLALVNGQLVVPYNSDAGAQAAAANRLNAHWNQAGLAKTTDGATVLPGLGYSPAQLANDLSLAGTTGALDARSEQLRHDAQERLAKYSYTKQDQDDDQIINQRRYLPVDDPIRQAEVRRLILEKGLTPADAQRAFWQESVDAQHRLEQTGTPLLTPAQTKDLQNTTRSYGLDPRKQYTPDNTPYNPDHKFTESDFRNWLGDVTGLNDLREGVENHDWGQAALGGATAIITLVPGADVAILGKLGKGMARVGDKLAPEIGPEITGLGGVARGGKGDSSGSPLYHPWDGGPQPTLYQPSAIRPGLTEPQPWNKPRPGAGAEAERDLLSESLDSSAARGGHGGRGDSEANLRGSGSVRAEGDGSPLDLDERFPVRQKSPAKIKDMADASEILNAFKLGNDGKESLGQALFDGFSDGSYAKDRALEVVGSTAKYGKNAILGGVRDDALRWAYENSEKGNPVNFANLYEYYKVAYDDIRESLIKGVDYVNKSERDAVAASRLKNLIDTGTLDTQLALDRGAVSRSGRGSQFVNPFLVDGERVKAIQNLKNLGFDDWDSSAYHARKHWREMPTPESTRGAPDIVAYQNSAEATIKYGRLVGVSQEPYGALKYVFHRTKLVDGKIVTTESIVEFNPYTGKTSIASYGGAKAVKIEPGGKLAPTYHIPPLPSDLTSTTLNLSGYSPQGMQDWQHVLRDGFSPSGSIPLPFLLSGLANSGAAQQDEHKANGPQSQSLQGGGLVANILSTLNLHHDATVGIAATELKSGRIAGTDDRPLTINIAQNDKISSHPYTAEAFATWTAGMHIV
ncbi:hypothetical protein [Nocardia sp. NPDC056100]|uniref:hypothetical protein n=1 Tax=Nocardia sp. NPDC056100 TaxID=3345712 RepID=UPI0035D61485